MTNAIARVITVTLFAALLAGFCDYWWRYREWVPRAISLGVVVSISLWGFRRWLIPALDYQLSETETAQQIERSIPSLRGKLASAVEMLSAPHPSRGTSQALVETTVRQATESVRSVPLGNCLESATIRRSVYFAAISIGLTALVSVFDPSSSQLAAQRLANPFSSTSWPQRHRLMFANWKERIAVGQDLDLEVVDANGRLPATVTVQVRKLGSDEIQSHNIRTTFNRVIDRWENRLESLEIRAMGGDDESMEWKSILVCKPPRITELEMRINPPEYSGLTPRVVVGDVRALAGSTITLNGTVDRPIKRAVVATSTRTSGRVDLSLDITRRKFVSGNDTWVLDSSGNFKLELEDDYQVAARSAAGGDIQVLSDTAPRISWEDPSSNAVVTPDGYLPIQVTVRDDLAIEGVHLLVQIAGSNPESNRNEYENTHEITLYQGPDRPAPPEFPRLDQGDLVRIDSKLELSKVNHYRAGDTIEIKVIASDYLPNTTTSAPLRVRIVSQEAIAEQFTRQQFGLLAKLEEAARLQREVLNRSASWLEKASTDSDSRSSADDLKGVQYSQRRVRQLVIENRDSVQVQVSALLQEYARNQLGGSSNSGRLNEIASRLEVLDRKQFAAVDSDLSDSVNALSVANTPVASAQSVATAINRVIGNQRDLISEFDAILAVLVEWESMQRLASEAQRVDGAQEVINAATERVLEAGNVLRDNNLPPQELEALNNLARQQFDNSRDIERLLARVRQTLESSKHLDPVARQAFSEAIRAAEQAAVVAAARAAAAELERRRIGEAITQQAKLQSGLRALSAALSQRPERDLERVAAHLRHAASQLAEIRDKQNQAIERWNGQPASDIGPQEAARFAEKQREIASDLDQLRSGLKRMPARNSAASLDRAANSAGKSAEAAQSDNVENAQQLAQETGQTLKDAQEQLKSELQAALEQQLQQRVARLTQQVAQWTATQDELNQTSDQVAATFQSEPARASRGDQAAEISRTLLNQQKQLADDVGKAAGGDYREHVFAISLELAAEAMNLAADQIQLSDWSRAKASQLEASQQLRLLAEALSSDRDPKSNDKQDEQQDDPNNNKPRRKVLSLAELKLLRSMQVTIQTKTNELDASRRKETRQRVPEVKNNIDIELDRLAIQQGKLADRVRELVEAESEVQDNGEP